MTENKKKVFKLAVVYSCAARKRLLQMQHSHRWSDYKKMFIRRKFLLHSPQRKPKHLLIFFSVYDHKHRAHKVYGCNNRCLDPKGIGPFITPTWVAFKFKSSVWFFTPDWRSQMKVIMIGNGLNINNYMCRWGPRYQSISCKAITTKTPPQLLFMFIIKLMIDLWSTR